MGQLGRVFLGMVIGFAGMGVLSLVYFAGRASAPTSTPAPPLEELEREPVAPPPPAPPPAPPTPLEAASAQLVEASIAFRSMTDEQRAATLREWGPIGEPSFASLSRGTDAHIGERACYRGTVEEIHDVEGGAELRLALRAYGQDVIYVFVGNRPAESIVARSRVLVCGIHMGSYTYTSQAGWQITLPLLGSPWIEPRR
jgi:hypothetical protein